MPPRQCVVVRTYDPSPATAERIAEWAGMASQTNNVDFCVQIDISRQIADGKNPGERRSRKRRRTEVASFQSKTQGQCGAAHAVPASVSPTHRIMRALANRSIKIGKKVTIHRYTESDLVSAFPQLSQMRHLLLSTMKVRELVSGKVSLAWGFHVEALLLWWRKLLRKRASSTSLLYDFVWIIEDDVGVAGGSIFDVVSKYAESHPNTDFLTRGVAPVGQDWYWKNVHTHNFLDSVNNTVLTNKEHVQRLSSKMFSTLDKIASTGVASWSEMHVPSVANCPKYGLSWDELLRYNIGEIYAWDGRINSEEEWEQIQRNVNSRAEEEQRIDASSIGSTGSRFAEAFTKNEFLQFYGDLHQWESSEQAPDDVVFINSIKIYHALKW